VKKSVVLGTLLLSGLIALAVPAPARASVTVNLAYFHQTLSPHGHWVVSTSYGDVWQPAVAAGWEPYVDGEWQYTDWGWTWVSNESFGDVAYHYGTWVWTARWGWVWVPGTVWAPAWVTWACTDDFVGWAPVPPSFVLTASGYVGRPIVVAQTRYVFVPARQFIGVPVNRVRVAVDRNPAIFSRASKFTTFRTSGGVVRNVGLPPARVEKAVGRRIEPSRIDPARVHMATLADSGVSRESRVAVVAPKAERARAIQAPEKSGANRANAKTAGGAPARAPEANRGSQPERVAKAAPALRSKPAPKTREGELQRGETARATAPSSTASAERKPAPPQSAHEPKKKKKPEAEQPARVAEHKPEPRREPAPKVEPNRNESRERTDVAAVRPAPAAARPKPAPKPKATAERPHPNPPHQPDQQVRKDKDKESNSN
jgi:hypothetical protein